MITPALVVMSLHLFECQPYEMATHCSYFLWLGLFGYFSGISLTVISLTTTVYSFHNSIPFIKIYKNITWQLIIIQGWFVDKSGNTNKIWI